MFDSGKKVYFRDEEFKAQIGTIIGKIDENSAFVTLRVRGVDGKIHSVRKINPDAMHKQQAEESYRQYGHY